MRNFSFLKIIKKFSHNKEKIAVMFPGQGFQFVGMLNDFVYPKNKEYQTIIDLFDEVLYDNIANKLSTLMTLEQDDSDELLKIKRKLLNETKIAQPAILLQSILNFHKFVSNKDFTFEIDNLFGPSLGEIISLVIADSLSYKDSARLLYKRGECMQLSCPIGEGAMLNVVGDVNLTKEKFNIFYDSLIEYDKNYINISSINSKRLLVISGKNMLIDKCMKFLKDNLIACKKMPVSAAFHSKLMEKGQILFKDYLMKEKIKITKPKYKILSTVEYNFFEDNKNSLDFEIKLKNLLIKQFTEHVDLLKCIHKNQDEGIQIYDMNKRKFIDKVEYI